MTDETPNFSTQSIEPEKPKRRVSAKKRAVPAEREIVMKNKDIDSKLNSIYRNDSGYLPDMKKIDMSTSHSIFSKLFGFIIALGVIAVAAWAGFFLMPKNGTTTDKPTLTISLPKDMTVGATTTIKIFYRNTQAVTLKNAVLTVTYPNDFVVSEVSVPANNLGKTEWKLGNLAPQDKGEILVTGLPYGEQSKPQSWRALLNYQPTNFQSDMQVIAIEETTLGESPFRLTLSGPDRASVGVETEFRFDITTNAQDLTGKLILEPILPAGFVITTSSLPLTKNQWLLNQPTSTTNTAPLFVTMRGKFGDGSNGTATIGGKLFWQVKNGDALRPVSNSEIKTTLSTGAVTLDTAVNGSLSTLSAKPGDNLRVTISLKNIGSDAANKLKVKLVIDAPSIGGKSALDWPKIADPKDGDITGTQLSDSMRRGEIVWTEKHFSDLKKVLAGKEVLLELSLPIRDAKAFDWSSAKEFKGVISASIEYVDKTGATQTISGNNVNLVFNSDLALEVRAEGSTTRKITWIITNTAHPLKDLSLSADIIGDIVFTGPNTAPAGQYTFDTAKGKLTWTITNITENMDVLAFPFTVTINKTNPTQTVLVSKPKLTATDTITGETITVTGDAVPVK